MACGAVIVDQLASSDSPVFIPSLLYERVLAEASTLPLVRCWLSLWGGAHAIDGRGLGYPRQ
jgi:hypothetical protein